MLAAWGKCSHVRTEEEVVGVWTVSANLENLYHVKELTVYISHHCYWRFYVDDIALLHQQLLCLGAYCFDNALGEKLFLVEAGYAFVQIDAGYVRSVYMVSRRRYIPILTRQAGHL